MCGVSYFNEGDFLILILSITTVEIIIIPPSIVVGVGYSLKKNTPRIIPYTGCNELIKLAETVEKCFRQ